MPPRGLQVPSTYVPIVRLRVQLIEKQMDIGEKGLMRGAVNGEPTSPP
jgi:hypothetical protein